ncbi:MAG: cell division protein FtsZ [Chloroflexi bacterium]|nr:cell division protein FtsZ [Chloroflexota bacterium]
MADSTQTNSGKQFGVCNIKIIGCGGGGSNTVRRMLKETVPHVEMVAVNTDAQALLMVEGAKLVRIGDKLTRGLGAGGDPNLGKLAAEESRAELAETVSGADMVFVTAGMGGGTGTGAAPVVAELAKEAGALTISVVTKPFSFEGARRMKAAEEGITRLKEKCDTIIAVPNDRLLGICDKKVTMEEAFKLADEIVFQGISSISHIVNMPGQVNVDFADIKSIMNNAGPALMAIGKGKGENRAIDAAKAALNCPLLDVSVEGARGIIFNMIGGNDLTLSEVNQAAELITKAADPDAMVFFGMVNDPTLDKESEVKIVLVAAGVSMGYDSSKAVSNYRSTDARIYQLLPDASAPAERALPPFLQSSRPPVRKDSWSKKLVM